MHRNTSHRIAPHTAKSEAKIYSEKVQFKKQTKKQQRRAAGMNEHVIVVGVSSCWAYPIVVLIAQTHVAGGSWPVNVEPDVACEHAGQRAHLNDLDDDAP